jgi:hypothetical protein
MADSGLELERAKFLYKDLVCLLNAPYEHARGMS